MREQVERLLAEYIEEMRLSKVEPLETQHEAEAVGSDEWWATFDRLQVERAKIQGMETALSFIEGVHLAQSA